MNFSDVSATFFQPWSMVSTWPRSSRWRPARVYWFEYVLLGGAAPGAAAPRASRGRAVIGTVSVRNDPMDAIEETIFSEPIDEIMLSVAPHGLSTWLHQDLAHRLHHFGLPVTVVAADVAKR